MSKRRRELADMIFEDSKKEILKEGSKKLVVTLTEQAPQTLGLWRPALGNIQYFRTEYNIIANQILRDLFGRRIISMIPTLVTNPEASSPFKVVKIHPDELFVSVTGSKAFGVNATDNGFLNGFVLDSSTGIFVFSSYVVQPDSAPPAVDTSIEVLYNLKLLIEYI